MEHVKTIWVGPDLENSPNWRDGGYAIWGQFETIMDHYTGDLTLLPPSWGVDANWMAKGIPNGLG